MRRLGRLQRIIQPGGQLSRRVANFAIRVPRPVSTLGVMTTSQLTGRTLIEGLKCLWDLVKLSPRTLVFLYQNSANPADVCLGIKSGLN